MVNDSTAQQIGIEAVRKRDGSDGDALLLARGNHFGFEFGAVPPPLPAGLVFTFVSMHVPT